MAAALTGVQRFQPALVTAPTFLSLPASAAAAFRATALARVPPNQAARPTSWRERDSVLRAMAELLRVEDRSTHLYPPVSIARFRFPGRGGTVGVNSANPLRSAGEELPQAGEQAVDVPVVVVRR